MSKAILQVQFESPEALQSEFEKNIANGGIFIPTEADLSIREAVTVAVELGYGDAAATTLQLEGEVVHRIPPEMTASGAVPGVAIQFEATAKALRDQFAPLLGQESPAAPVDKDTEGAGRRGSRRGAARVPVRVMPTMSPPFEATSRDLSGTGILLTVREIVLPLKEIVRICLWHPSGSQSVEIDGQVVRQVRNKSGRIAAVAIAFDRNQAADPRIKEVIDALRQAGHRSRLGGIGGSLEDLGLANMLQMFGASAPQGTLVVESDGEQGWIAFADGALLAAELGARRGHDALVAMLAWSDGRFEFEASADAKLVESAERRPLAGAVLEAVCAIDEQDAAGGDEAASDDAALDEAFFGSSAPDATVVEGMMPAREGIAIGPDTTFSVDVFQADVTRDQLDKTDEAVLELAGTGLAYARLVEVIPEEAEAVEASVETLVELGVLVPS